MIDAGTPSRTGTRTPAVLHKWSAAATYIVGSRVSKSESKITVRSNSPTGAYSIIGANIPR
jgi:hypothetical protein